LFRCIFQFYKKFFLIFALLLGHIYYWSSETQAAGIHLAWDDTSQNEDGFKIERLVAGLIDKTLTVGGNVTSYFDTGLTTGVTYCYRVRAYNSVGESSNSNQPCSVAKDTTITAKVSTTQFDAPITANWDGILGATAKDWIGLHVQGAVDGDFVDWMYVSCSKSADTAKASGACSFALPATISAQNYELRLFFNDSYTRLAASNVFSFGTTGNSTTLTATPTTVNVGGAVNALWGQIAAPSPTDWIGLYLPSTSDRNIIDWIYVSCSRTVGVANNSGTCAFNLLSPLASGNYELRLFSNDRFIRLAVSNSFQVTGGQNGSPILPPPPSGLQVKVGM
jgi:hypothetical protein